MQQATGFINDATKIKILTNIPSANIIEMTHNTRRTFLGVMIVGSFCIITFVILPNILLFICHYRQRKSHLPDQLVQLYLKNDTHEFKPEIIIHGKAKRSYKVKKMLVKQFMELDKKKKSLKL